MKRLTGSEFRYLREKERKRERERERDMEIESLPVLQMYRQSAILEFQRACIIRRRRRHSIRIYKPAFLRKHGRPRDVQRRFNAVETDPLVLHLLIISWGQANERISKSRIVNEKEKKKERQGKGSLDWRATREITQFGCFLDSESSRLHLGRS